MSSSRGHRTDSHPNGKMRIKAFPQSMDERFVTQIWNQLKKSIQEIQKKNNSGLSFEELYRNAYTMVLQKHGDRLYYGTKDVVAEHMCKIREELIRSLNSGSFLTTLSTYWKDHQVAMIMIRDILMYMDRVYVTQHNLASVYSMGLEAFRDGVILHPPIRHFLQNTLLDLVAQDRRGEVVLLMHIREATQMLVQLGINSTSVYESEFESHFLAQSRDFYRAESERFLAENTSASLYIKKVKQRIEEEERRAEKYLDPSTKPKIIKVLENVLITAHVHRIVDMENSGLVFMLTHDRYDDIKEMFSLLNRTEQGPKIMSDCISQYLRNCGRAIVEEDVNKTPQTYIQELLQLKEKFDKLLIQALNNERIFRNQINADFEHFINLNPQSPEYLSLYIDEKLKRGSRGVTEQDVESVMDKCIVLFRLLQEKDTFERYYKNHLAKRLLNDKSQSDDQEKSMISKLKRECGCDFTSKLEGMFKDIALSHTFMEDFNQHLSTQSLPPNLEAFDVSVRVLTTGYWPGPNVTGRIQLPEEVEQKFTIFTKFYLSKHCGRRLNLQPHLGSADMPCYFPYSNPTGPEAMEVGNAPQSSAGSQPRPGAWSDLTTATGGVASADMAANMPLQAAPRSSTSNRPRRYILTVSTYQMIILNKFNEHPRLTFQELKQETNIPDRDLIRALQSLACAKPTQRILLKEPRSPKDVSPTDVFSINEAFVSKHIKIKVQSLSSRESEPERLETKQKVDMNRNYVVEAAIMRIMKARKEMEHNLLVAEVTNQLRSRFQPAPQLIKSRIENLLEREFLARKEDRRVYVYKA